MNHYLKRKNIYIDDFFVESRRGTVLGRNESIMITNSNEHVLCARRLSKFNKPRARVTKPGIFIMKSRVRGICDLEAIEV